MDFTKHMTNRRETPQTKKVPGVKKQVRNDAGGVSFSISKWDYLMRFLILGTEGGTYYVSEKKLTVDACKNVQKCIDEDGKRAVNTIVFVSVSGRAADNDAAIFALAMAASCSNPDTRKFALSQLDKVCRIGTHLFHFIRFVKTMRGFGRGLREAIAYWYTSKKSHALAYQMLKYQGRDGWTHGDVIRLAHPIPVNDSMNDLFSYAVGKREDIPEVSDYAVGMKEIRTLEGSAKDFEKAAILIRRYKLTREAIPTQFLNDVRIWEALLENMPMTALVRNLGKMSSLNMHKSFSDTLKMTTEKLTDETAIQKSRIHPMQIMNAMITYGCGRGIKGNLSWDVNGKVMDALEAAFYMSFENVEPTEKNILLALDVSGSMTTKLSNSLMSCRVASAVLAMITMKVEQYADIIGFTERGYNAFHGSNRGYVKSTVSQLPISPKQRIDDVVRTISKLGFSGTDCALPMIYCYENKIDVDAICIYTDSETWAGNIHPWQALDKLEQKLGHKVKCIVVGMVSNGFSIARTDYANMLDVVGFSTDTPSVISEFIRN